MIHHGRLRWNPAEITQRPNTILGRHMSDSCGSWLSQCPTSYHLYLLYKLMPINFRTILVLLKHTNVVRSFGQDGALCSFGDYDTSTG
mmetsp:Transcript_26535/g.76690  ORF Transcript_26535/g.76690 Transcript_26535/m.76690 type:complete len:88 (-) Transcript_26535:806-1069(-)